MLSQDKLKKYADVLIWALSTARGDKYKKSDLIMIRFDVGALKLAELIQEKVLKMGMHPVLRLGSTSIMERNFFNKANKDQLVFNPPGEMELYQNLNGGIYLNAPESLTHLSDVDPAKIGKVLLAKKPFREILDKRETKGLFGWTLCMIPTAELAKKAGLSLKQYSSQIIKACYLDKSEPTNEWKKIYRNAMKIKRWLNNLKVKHFEIESKNMALKIVPGEKRRWVGISGHNIPSFELFISPDWRGTEGVYFANQPSYRSGNYIEGVKLTFHSGVAVKTEAWKGGNFVKKQLSIDKGASRVGEFSLTDKRFSRINRFMANTLYDENFGGRYGNCHLALGSSYADTFDGDPSKLTKLRKDKLGLNDSALHWDLVNTENKIVTAHLSSGKKTIIYENGAFNY